MAALEDIAYWQRKSTEEIEEIKRTLFRMETPPPSPEPFPELYINNREVQRILNVSETTVTSFTKYGILIKRKNEKCPTNCYSSTEVLWLSKQKYTHLKQREVKLLQKRRQEELGF